MNLFSTHPPIAGAHPPAAGPLERDEGARRVSERGHDDETPTISTSARDGSSPARSTRPSSRPSRVRAEGAERKLREIQADVPRGASAELDATRERGSSATSSGKVEHQFGGPRHGPARVRRRPRPRDRARARRSRPRPRSSTGSRSRATGSWRRSPSARARADRAGRASRSTRTSPRRSASSPSTIRRTHDTVVQVVRAGYRLGDRVDPAGPGARRAARRLVRRSRRAAPVRPLHAAVHAPPAAARRGLGRDHGLGLRVQSARPRRPAAPADRVASSLTIAARVGVRRAANAASNVINQYYDVENDRINKPDRPLVTGEISMRRRVVVRGRALRGRGRPDVARRRPGPR